MTAREEHETSISGKSGTSRGGASCSSVAEDAPGGGIVLDDRSDALVGTRAGLRLSEAGRRRTRPRDSPEGAEAQVPNLSIAEGAAHGRVALIVDSHHRRYTRARRILVSLLIDRCRPVTVAELCQWSGSPESSVYRNMRELQDAGVIESVWGADPIERFELAPCVLGADHHHHLVCTACGLIIDDVAPEELDA